MGRSIGRSKNSGIRLGGARADGQSLKLLHLLLPLLLVTNENVDVAGTPPGAVTAGSDSRTGWNEPLSFAVGEFALDRAIARLPERSQGREALAAPRQSYLEPRVRHHRQEQHYRQSEDPHPGANQSVQPEGQRQTEPLPEQRARQWSLPRSRIQSE